MYPKFVDDLLVHDSFFSIESNSRKLPARLAWEFVGERVGDDDSPDVLNREVLRKISRNPVRKFLHFRNSQLRRSKCHS